MAFMTNTNQQICHFIFFIHGIFGNEKELGYLRKAMKNMIESKKDITLSPKAIVLHSVKCNVGRNCDGVVNGGSRLAQEVKSVIAENQLADETLAILSFVGNSLGGIYARYAIAHIEPSERILPFIFCTIATPHLGIANHTHIPIPSWTEKLVANYLGATGQDLFQRTPLLYDMATLPKYMDPLQRFRKRIALANAFGTDFQVPISTAAFLSKTSEVIHHTLPSKTKYVLTVETKPTNILEQSDISQNLDALGWIKIFFDVRKEIPFPSIPRPFAADNSLPKDQAIWRSSELRRLLNSKGKRWNLPCGHMVSCVNSRDKFYEWLSAKGQPFMDQLAEDLVQLIQEFEVYEMDMKEEKCLDCSACLFQ
jgi:hypothetical protein